MSNQNVLKSLPVAQLFSLMASNDVHTTMSSRAYYEFQYRYEKILWNTVKEVCNRNNFDKIKDLDKEVYKTSMQEVYINAISFQESKSKVSKEIQDQLLVGWFGKIAETVMENIISDHKKFEKVHLIIPDYPDHLKDLKSFQQDKDEIEENENKRNKADDLLGSKMRIYENGMQELKPREREILMEYFSLAGGRKYLSEDRIVYLCTKWKISQDNLLQIKHRAFLKLKSYCNDEQKKTENESKLLNS